MNERDAYNLMVETLRWISGQVYDADSDPDSDPWLYLEDIDMRCQDILGALPPTERTTAS